MRDPGDATDKLALLNVGSRGRGEPEDDFRLDARLGESGERDMRVRAEGVHSGRVNVAPNWRGGLKSRPCGTIGEPHLASDRPVAAGNPSITNRPRHAIGVGEL